MVQIDVAANVRAELARAGKTQEDAAVVLNKTRQAVSRRLLGRVPFDVHEVTALADYLGIPVAVLFGSSTERASA